MNTSPSGRKGRADWSVFGLTATAVFLVSFDATVATAAFPALRSAFPETSPEQLSWVLNAYTLVYASLLAPLGGWTDARGRRRSFLQGVAFFTAASALCGLAPSAGTLIAARAFQAVGAALLSPAALALSLAAFPPEKRALVASLWGAVGALAAALGPALGSWLMDAFSWRAIFWVNLPLGLATLWRGRALAPDTPAEVGKAGAPARPDWIGAALLSGGFGLLVLGIVRAEAVGWLSIPTGTTLGAGALVLGGFVRWAWARPNAAVDLRLFSDPNFRSANAATLLFGACFGLMFLSFYLFMTGVWHYSQSLACLAAMLGSVLVMPFAVAGGRIATRHGHRTLLVIGGALYALAQLWFYVRPGEKPDYLHAWLPGQIASGAAIGLVLPGLTGAAVAGLPKHALATGNAINQAVRQLGLAMGVALAVALAGRPDAHLGEFRIIYLLLAAGGLGTALLARRIDTRPPATSPA